MFVVVVWFCCSSWLAFLILTYYSNLMHQFLLHWVICFGGYHIVHTEFFEKDLGFLWDSQKNNFWVFLSVPHLVDNYAKIVDGRGGNLMCHRTLPSRLVSIKLKIYRCENSALALIKEMLNDFQERLKTGQVVALLQFTELTLIKTWRISNGLADIFRRNFHWDFFLVSLSYKFFSPVSRPPSRCESFCPLKSNKKLQYLKNLSKIVTESQRRLRSLISPTIFFFEWLSLQSENVLVENLKTN